MSLWYGVQLPKLLFGAYIGIICALEMLLRRENGKRRPPFIISMVITMCLFHLGIAFFICSDLMYAVKFIPVLFGRNGMLIDNLTLYFFQNFVVLMVIGVFITSGLAKLCYEKLEGTKRSFFTFLRPLSQLALLVISTAFMSGTHQEYLGLFFN